MNRRRFLQTMIGGIAVAAAVRTFPFRVYSFPTKLVLAPFTGGHLFQTPFEYDEIFYDNNFMVTLT